MSDSGSAFTSIRIWKSNLIGLVRLIKNSLFTNTNPGRVGRVRSKRRVIKGEYREMRTKPTLSEREKTKLNDIN